MTGVVLLMLVVAMILQSVITFFQIKAYHRNLNEMKGKGLLGIGSRRGGFLQKGDIVIVSFDRAMGKVIDCRRMHGITSFQKFKVVPEWIGLDLEAIGAIAKEENEKVMSRKDKRYEEMQGLQKGKYAALYQAVDAIGERLKADEQKEEIELTESTI
ncbi:MAG: transcriptional regulator GutM [Bacillota bacterium]